MALWLAMSLTASAQDEKAYDPIAARALLDDIQAKVSAEYVDSKYLTQARANAVAEQARAEACVVAATTERARLEARTEPFKNIDGDVDPRKLFDRDVITVFERYPWPGNVRELEAMTRRLALMARHSGRATIEMLPELMAAGVTALKIEGRQRGKAYVSKVVGAFRRAVDAAASGEAAPPVDLRAVTEGQSQTTGAYRKAWQ